MAKSRTVADPEKKHAERLREMSFFEHLADLRNALIHSVVIFSVLTIACWFFSGTILDLLVRDLPVDRLYFTSPVEAFTIRMKVSAVLGLLLAFPVILFKTWSFVAPALFAREKRHVYPLTVASAILFYMGAFFAYFVLVPVVLKFLVGFGTEHLNPLLSVSAYFAFVARLSLVCGIVFQVPIAVLLLSYLGLVSPRYLLKQWRYGVLGVFTAAAILTPPDALSMMLVGLPVLVLYIGSILVAFVVVRRKKQREARENATATQNTAEAP
jgi:sec-independent protein translocase protein TatC